MLLNSLFRTAVCVKLPNLNSISIFVRWKGFTHSENLRPKFDWDFRRKVLQSTDGCILYDPSKNYNPSQKFIQNDETILNLMQFIKTYDLNSSDHRTIIGQFDGMCLQSSQAWIIDQTLFVLDIWDSLHPYRSSFSAITPNLCLKHLEEIPKEQKLQLLHYLAYSKQLISEANQTKIIQVLDKNLEDLTIEEASFYYSAIVRCGEASAKYSNETTRFINHLKRRELRDANQLAVSSALKAIRALTAESNIEDLKSLQRRLVPLVKRSNTYQLTQFAQLGHSQRIFNPKLLELVIERSIHLIRTEPKSFRLKDVERILLALSTYRSRTLRETENQLCDEIQPLLKESFDSRFPCSLTRCIAFLAIIGLADHELIDWALKRCVISEARHLLVIDSFAKVNLKGAYNGHVLSDETCSYLESIAQTEIIDGFYLDMQNDLMNLFKMYNYCASVIKMIPHFIQPDLVFIYNTRTHETFEVLQPNKRGSIIHASELYNKEPNLIAVAIVRYGIKSTLHTISSGTVIGRMEMKMEQLKLLGFHIVPLKVSISRWNNSNLDEKRQLLRDRLWVEQIKLFHEKIEGE